MRILTAVAAALATFENRDAGETHGEICGP